LNKILLSNKLFSGQATKTKTSISGKFNNFAGFILPVVGIIQKKKKKKEEKRRKKKRKKNIC
jgi:hypothetical protein